MITRARVHTLVRGWAASRLSFVVGAESLVGGRASKAKHSPTRGRERGGAADDLAIGALVDQAYPTQLIYPLVLESQLPHKIVNLLSIVTKLRVSWGG